MSSPRVPVFQSNRIDPNKADVRESGRGEEGSRVDVKLAYLPPIYGDRDQGGQNPGNGQGGQNEALVNFFAGADTGQLNAFGSRVEQANRPMWAPGSVLSLIGPNAMPAYYAPKSRAEDNRRNWGDFLPGGSTRAKFSPLDGMDITFDPNDRPISVNVPRTQLAANTTVPEEMDFQVRAGMFSAQLNRGNPRLDRLQVYNLAGVNLRG